MRPVMKIQVRRIAKWVVEMGGQGVILLWAFLMQGTRQTSLVCFRFSLNFIQQKPDVRAFSCGSPASLPFCTSMLVGGRVHVFAGSDWLEPVQRLLAWRCLEALQDSDEQTGSPDEGQRPAARIKWYFNV